MPKVAQTQRADTLKRIASALALVLAIRILFSIVYEYRFYFPADFHESTFLLGRENTFYGSYATAFYIHIISGPVAVVAGIALLLMGLRIRSKRTGFPQKTIRAHRILGRLQFVLVVAFVAPSGLWMATRAATGHVAGAGFAVLSLATGGCMVAAVQHARKGNIDRH